MYSLFVVSSFLVCALNPINTCLAYIDPGSGSMLLQIVLAGGAGLIVLLKYVRGRFHFWRLKKADSPASDVSSSDATVSKPEQSPTNDVS